jgi:periodic tryptophan protein 1
MISTLAWVPKGVPKPVPEPAPPTEEELEAMRRAATRAAQAALRRGNRAHKGGGSGEGSSEEDDDDDASMSEEEEEEDEATAVARAKRAAALLASGGGGKRGGTAAGNGLLPSSSSAPQTIDEALRDLDMRFPEEGEADEDAARAELIGRAFRTVADGSDDEDEDGAVADADEDDENENDDEEDSEEADAFVIRPSDMLIIAGRHEDDVSTLEVWLYEEASAETGGEANLYVHHDLLLPSFPLCAARVDLRSGGNGGGGKNGNLVAVGTMEPGIDVWDLDVMDAVEPLVTLGGYVKPRSAQAAAEAEAAGQGEDEEDDDDGTEESAAARRSKAKKDKKRQKDKDRKRRQKEARRKPELRPDSHEDAVLAVSWNPLVRNALASASADHTVKLWDLAAAAGAGGGGTRSSSSSGCTATLTHHRGKVQAVAWNPAEAPVLLTGAFDRTACVVDARAPTSGGGGKKGAGGAARPPTWQLSADVEAVAWNPSNPTSFVVSSEDGLVVCFDARAGAGELCFHSFAFLFVCLGFFSFRRLTIPGFLAAPSLRPPSSSRFFLGKGREGASRGPRSTDAALWLMRAADPTRPGYQLPGALPFLYATGPAELNTCATISPPFFFPGVVPCPRPTHHSPPPPPPPTTKTQDPSPSGASPRMTSPRAPCPSALRPQGSSPPPRPTRPSSSGTCPAAAARATARATATLLRRPAPSPPSAPTWAPSLPLPFAAPTRRTCWRWAAPRVRPACGTCGRSKRSRSGGRSSWSGRRSSRTRTRPRAR